MGSSSPRTVLGDGRNPLISRPTLLPLSSPMEGAAMLIGGQDVLPPSTMVGNYPNPRWYDGHAFATLPTGEFIHDSISKEAFEDTVGPIVHDQEAAGRSMEGPPLTAPSCTTPWSACPAPGFPGHRSACRSTPPSTRPPASGR